MALNGLSTLGDAGARRTNLGVGYETLTMSAQMRPTGYVAESFPRGGCATVSSAGTALASGVLLCVAVWLPKDTVVSKLAVLFGGTGSATATHWWFALLDSSRVYLAQTADQLTAAIPAATLKSLPIAATAAGAATTFRTTYDGIHYIAVLVTATGMPTVIAPTVSATLSGIAPIMCGTSTAALTTPPAFPATAAAISATSAPMYACVG